MQPGIRVVFLLLALERVLATIRAMRCPVCQQSLHETSPACPHCSFDLAVASQHLGIAPRLQPDLTDQASVFTPSQASHLQDLLQEKERRFPQIRFAVVTVQVNPQIPLKAYSFWLLNRGNLATAMEKGGECRMMLFVLDAVQKKLCCMLGYGLEPFFSQEAMDEVLRPARPLLARGDMSGAVQASLQQADVVLVALSRAIPQVFGLHQEKSAAPLSGEAGFAY
ncbi:MAG: TPM domain-containing protein [Verrucomicrobium sp.]